MKTMNLIQFNDSAWVALRLLKDGTYRVDRYEDDADDAKSVETVSTTGYDDAMTHFRAMCKKAREGQA